MAAHPKEHREPWLAQAFALSKLKGLDPEGRLLLEGLRLVSGAARAGVPFEQVLFAPEFYVDDRCASLVDELQRKGVAAHRIETRTFSQLSYKAEGIVAVVRFKAPALNRAELPREIPLVVLDAVSDPGNIGGVIRTADAWGGAVAVVDTGPKLYHPKALRASMGALFHVPTFTVQREPAIAWVERQGRPVIALTPDGEAAVDEAPLADGPVMIVGNEKRGVHPDWMKIATVRLAIPMVGATVDSLNATTSAAVMLWEAFRRRNALSAGST